MESIVVDENHRNKGIGSKLMKKALVKCNRPIYLLATSELGGDVDKLTKFYESFGFEKAKQPRNDGLGFNYNMVLWRGENLIYGSTRFASKARSSSLTNLCKKCTSYIVKAEKNKV